MSDRREKWIIAAGIAIFVAAIMAVSWFKYQHFGFNGFDLAIYNQTFWNTVHGRLFADSINPPSYLTDHVEWLILALAPLYALAPHPLSLVFLQALALASGAVPLWLIAKTMKPSRFFRLFWVGLWLANPYVWNLALSEFHVIAFAVPLILWAAYFYTKQRWWPFIVISLVILLTREDLFLIVCGFALLAAWDLIRHRYPPSVDTGSKSFRFARHNAVRWIIIPVVLALVVFAIDQKVVAYFAAEGYKFFHYYDWLGTGPGGIAVGIITHPWRTLSHLLIPRTFSVIAAMLLPLLFLPLFRPRWLIVVWGVAAEYFLMQSGVDLIFIKMQYIAPFAPILMLSAMESQAALQDSRNKLWKILPKPIFPLLVILATIVVWLNYGPGPGVARAFAADTPRTKALRETVNLIPKDAAVITAMDTMTTLSSREWIWPVHYLWTGKKQFGLGDYRLPATPEYLILDEEDLLYLTSSFPSVQWAKTAYPTFDANLRQVIADGKFGVIYSQAGVALLKRGVGGAWPFVKILEKTPAIEHPAALAVGPFKFFGWNPASASLETGRRLYFSVEGKIEGDPILSLNGRPYLLGNGLYRPADWRPGELVEIEVQDDSPQLELGLIEVTGGLYVNGDGSLSLIVTKTKDLSPKLVAP